MSTHAHTTQQDLDRGAHDGDACVDVPEPRRTASIGVYVADARAWIADCWGDDLADSLTNGEVIDGVARHYDGGWAQFHRDAGRESAAQAVEAQPHIEPEPGPVRAQRQTS